MNWQDGNVELDTGRFSPGLALLLDYAMEATADARLSCVGETGLLFSLLTLTEDALLATTPTGREEIHTAVKLLRASLSEGVLYEDCLDAFREVAPRGAVEVNPFERENWRQPLASVIDGLADGARPLDLLRALFTSLTPLPEGELLKALFDSGRILSAATASPSDRSVFLASPGEDSDGQELDDSAFTPRARFLLDKALALTATTGGAVCDTATLLTVMLTARDTYTQLIMRRAGASVTTARATSHFATATAPMHPAAPPLPPTRSSIDPHLASLLGTALQQALVAGETGIGERELLGLLVQDTEPKVRYLVDDVLGLPILLIEELAREMREPLVIEPYLPQGRCTVRNVSTALQASPQDAPVPRDDLVAPLGKVMFRKKRRNVLLHGERGTGASTVADILADALRCGRFPPLRHTHVIAVDLTSVDEADYVTETEHMLAFMDSEPDHIYVVEGFGPYFAEQFASCARRFSRNTYRLIVLVTPPDYTALLAGSEPLGNFMDVQELTEPSPEITAQIVGKAMGRITTEYGVLFSDKAAQSAIRMSGDYMLATRFPAKAVALLERAAADVAAEAAMHRRPPAEVDRTAIATQVAAATGLACETILGTGQDKDYVDLLSANLVGQDVAVLKVAGRLDLIQKGLVDKKAPAAVFVFAGLSGTGKTELAKQIAQIYSQTHAMISFPMENFGESNSVTKIIGSPPGYVGFGEGGPLINALNRDPYAVVLLDEIEKAHPAVWDPFLNLFDEGTITDSKGVTASGSKAFFVLTSNIGQYEIADMLASGRSAAEIEEAVMKLFPQYVHEQARIPCFRPEFVGRIMRRGGLVAFNGLSYEALLGITRASFARIARDFTRVHESQFMCDDDVLELIARTIYAENDAAIRERRPGYFGARRIHQLLDQYVSNKLAEKIRHLAGAPLVRVVLNGRDTELIPVYSNADAAALLAERHAQLLGRVERRFGQLVTVPDDALAGLPEAKLQRLDRLLSEVGGLL